MLTSSTVKGTSALTWTAAPLLLAMAILSVAAASLAAVDTLTWTSEELQILDALNAVTTDEVRSRSSSASLSRASLPDFARQA